MSFHRTTFEPHPEGVTVGQFTDLKDEPDGKFGPQIRLSFDTDEEMDDGRPFRVAYWITSAFNPKSNCFKFFRAMGVDVENITDAELGEIDLNDFIGKKCQIVVEHKKNATDGTIQAKVANLLPIKKRAARAAQTEERELVGAGAKAGSAPPFEEDD